MALHVPSSHRVCARSKGHFLDMPSAKDMPASHAKAVWRRLLRVSGTGHQHNILLLSGLNITVALYVKRTSTRTYSGRLQKPFNNFQTGARVNSTAGIDIPPIN